MNSEQLNREVMAIVGGASYPRFRFRLIFTVGGVTVTPLSILSKNSFANYATKFTADTELRIVLITKDYNLLYKNRDNLTATLIQEQIDPVSDVATKNGVSFQQKFRAFFTDNQPGDVGSSAGVASLPYTDGSDDMRSCNIQLVEPIAISMSAKNAQGIYRFTTVTNALQTFVVSSSDADAAKGLPKLAGVEMVAADVTETRDQIIIDNNVKMVELPSYLQHSEGGIYNHDIGAFIQNGFWYIYPLYNTKRFTSTERRLTVFLTSSLKIPTADITFSKTGESIRIVCTGGAAMQDLSVAGDITLGLGTRYTKASDFFDNQAVLDGNKATYNREAVSADITTTARPDGNTFAFTSATAITDNIAREQSRIASRKGMVMKAVWQRSDARYLTPGMPVRVYRDIGTEVVQLEGVLLQVNEEWSLERPGMMQQLQKSAAGLVFYLEKA